MESSLGFWVGVRTYSKLTEKDGGTFEGISKVPLVEGRSALSDGLCKEWINVSQRIPPEFWHNLKAEDNSNLKSFQTWKAIRSFADNCVLRAKQEQTLRTKKSLGPDDPVGIPGPGVVTKDEAEYLVADMSTSKQKD